MVVSILILVAKAVGRNDPSNRECSKCSPFILGNIEEHPITTNKMKLIIELKLKVPEDYCKGVCCSNNGKYPKKSEEGYDQSPEEDPQKPWRGHPQNPNFQGQHYPQNSGPHYSSPYYGSHYSGSQIPSYPGQPNNPYYGYSDYERSRNHVSEYPGSPYQMYSYSGKKEYSLNETNNSISSEGTETPHCNSALIYNPGLADQVTNTSMNTVAVQPTSSNESETTTTTTTTTTVVTEDVTVDNTGEQTVQEEAMMYIPYSPVVSDETYTSYSPYMSPGIYAYK